MRTVVLSSILLLLFAWSAEGSGVTGEESGVWLGVWLGDALDGGAEVVALAQGGPAQRAGIRVGDIIVEADGVPVSAQAALGELLEQRDPGHGIQLLLLRSGDGLEVEVVPERRPAAPARPLIAPAVDAAPAPPAVGTVRRNRLQSPSYGLIEGVRVAEITPALREHYGAPPDAGVLVVGVGSDDEIETFGLQVGDVLVRLAGRPVRDQRQLDRTLTTWPGNRPLEVLFVRGGESRAVRVEGRPEEREVRERTRLGAARAEADREILARRLEREIEHLRRRIQELEAELDGLRQED
jgi:S1-C subfamily serine protease